MMNAHRRTGTLILLAAAAAPVPARAQDAAGLEEIVVTAQKRSESLQDVPIAVTAFTGRALEELGIVDAIGVSAQTPSMAFSAAGGEAQIYLRGVGTNIFGIGTDSSVAINMDGIYLGRPNMGLTQFLDVERVEVLRGPQGTLYGRNATAGTLNVFSRQPTAELGGYLNLSYGEWDRIDAQGAVGGPISDALQFRVAARYMADDGYTDDLDSRGTNELDDNDLQAYRGILRYAPGDRFDATLSAEYTDFSNGNTSIVPRDDLGLATTLGAVPTGSLRETRNDLPTYFDWDSTGATLNLRWQFSDHLELTSITGYRDYTSDFLFNTDGTEIDVTRTNYQYDTDQLSTELRIASVDLERWRWLAGLYWFEEDKYGALGLVRAAGRPLPTFVPFNFLLISDGDTEAWAAFADASFDLTERVTLLAGIRYSDESKDEVTTQAIRRGDLLGLEGPAVPPSSVRSGEYSWDAWTPRFGIEFRSSEDLLLYATATRGFKSGGYNALSVGANANANPPFDPEYIWAYEVGAKSELGNGTTRLNVAAFYYDYSDLQVSSFLNNLVVITNAAEATVQGVEVEALTQATDQLTLGLNLAWLDATYDEFLASYGTCGAAVAAQPDCAGVPIGVARPYDAEGNRLVNAPKWKGTGSARYTIPLGELGTLDWLVQLTWTDDLYFTPINEETVGQEAFALLDARAAWLSADARWELAVLGRNLSDEEYYQNGVRFTSTTDPVRDLYNIGNALGYPAQGRSWAVQASYRF